MSKPTPIKWMGRTIEQEHILRYIDRENPFGEILAIAPSGPRALIATDCHGFDHRLVCDRDGTVCIIGEEAEQWAC